MVSWLLLHCKCLFLFFFILFNQNDNYVIVVVVVVKNGSKTNNQFRLFKADQNQKSIPKLVVTFIRIILNSAVFNKYFSIIYLYLYSFLCLIIKISFVYLVPFFAGLILPKCSTIVIIIIIIIINLMLM